MAEELRFAMRCHGSRQKPALRRSCSRCSPEGTYVPAAVDTFPAAIDSFPAAPASHRSNGESKGCVKNVGFGFSNPYDHNHGDVHHQGHHNGHHEHLVHRTGGGVFPSSMLGRDEQIVTNQR